jgi:Domain of unknown function (DUF4112)
VTRDVQADIPRVAVARMLANITSDTFVGSIPVFGDALDFAYKSNLKNLRIYEQSLIDPRGATTRHGGILHRPFSGDRRWLGWHRVRRPRAGSESVLKVCPHGPVAPKNAQALDRPVGLPD